MEHKYEVGDLVRILPRDGFYSDYMYCFTEEMLTFVGQICKIKHIIQCNHNGLSKKKHDDGNMYLLEGNTFSWASSMFEPYDKKKIDSSMLLPVNINTSTTDQITEVLKVKVTDDDNRYQINFNL